MKIKNFIEEIQDYPEKGVNFKDITPLLKNGKVYKYVIDEISDFSKDVGATIIIGPEARGFIIGCPVAYNTGLGFIPVRKPGKLPRETVTKNYKLEYGNDTLAIHKDDLKENDRVVIVDDVLATGGTIKTTIELIEKIGVQIVGIAFIINLENLKGLDKINSLGNYKIKILETY